MKKEKSTLNRRLKQYSAFGASILAGTTLANAQIVYTDIPDTTLTATPNPGQQYNLDLNNDGIVDYVFHAVGYGASNRNKIGLVMYPYYTTHINAIAGNVETLGNDFLGYPSALVLNQNIDSNLNFFKLTDLVNTLNNFDIPVMYSYSDGDLYGHWQGGLTDGFVGLKFSPDNSTIYFGWARCDVANDATSITIKDYAYNSVAGAPLFAGEGGPLGSVSSIHESSFDINAYDGVINIFTNDADFNGAVATVVNLNGETIVRKKIEDKLTQIDLNRFAKGIYMVQIQKGEKVVSKKISFQ